MHAQRKTNNQRKTATATRMTKRNRKHLQLIDPVDGAEILADRRIYTYNPATAWKIAVLMEDPHTREYDATFRTRLNEDEQEYVIFTLSLPQSNLYPLQVRIWPNNEIEYESHVPLVLRVHPRKKLITVILLASVRAVPEGIAVTYRE